MVIRILHEGHKVLYKQLLGWILQGKLFDPYGEFFIAEEEVLQRCARGLVRFVGN